MTSAVEGRRLRDPWTAVRTWQRRRAAAAAGGRPLPQPLDALVGADVVRELRRAGPSAVRVLEEAHLDARRHLPAAVRDHLDARLVTLLRGAAELSGPERRRELVAASGTVRGLVDRALDQDARRRYTAGLLLAVAGSLVLLTAVYAAAVLVISQFGDPASGSGRGLTRPEHYALRDVLVCVGGGAAGAVVSVLLRLSHTARLPVGVTHWRTVAVYRVALGWFFSAALLFALKSGVVAVVDLPAAGTDGTPTDPVTSWFLWGTVGFLAGFNERWVKNLFARNPEAAPTPAATAPPTPPPRTAREAPV